MFKTDSVILSNLPFPRTPANFMGWTFQGRFSSSKWLWILTRGIRWVVAVAGWLQMVVTFHLQRLRSVRVSCSCTGSAETMDLKAGFKAEKSSMYCYNVYRHLNGTSISCTCLHIYYIY